MLKWLLDKITPEKPIVSTIHASGKELTKIYHEEKVCPDCGVWDFYNGPEGGMSVNIVCGNCGSWFNDSGPFGIERIHNSGIDISAENYREFNRNILTNWDFFITHADMFDEIEQWIEENIDDLWSAKWGGDKNRNTISYYFESKESAMAFKLKWT